MRVYFCEIKDVDWAFVAAENSREAKKIFTKYLLPWKKKGLLSGLKTKWIGKVNNEKKGIIDINKLIKTIEEKEIKLKKGITFYWDYINAVDGKRPILNFGNEQLVIYSWCYVEWRN